MSAIHEIATIQNGAAQELSPTQLVPLIVDENNPIRLCAEPDQWCHFLEFPRCLPSFLDGPWTVTMSCKHWSPMLTFQRLLNALLAWRPFVRTGFPFFCEHSSAWVSGPVTPSPSPPTGTSPIAPHQNYRRPTSRRGVGIAILRQEPAISACDLEQGSGSPHIRRR